MEGLFVQRTGFARLPLHYGKAPRWLVVRMQKLAEEMVTIIVDEHGADEFLKRISDPFWGRYCSPKTSGTIFLVGAADPPAYPPEAPGSTALLYRSRHS